MKLRTLIREDEKLIPAEVEVHLLPGLPALHVLGLPDQVIKESVHRIRSALKAQGFQWPKARQVLVNIRPVHRRKSSRGLELAVAAGLLWETGQRKAPKDLDRMYVYGELALSGEVLEPEDLARDFFPAEGETVLTGAGPAARGFSRDRVSVLADLEAPTRDVAVEPLHEIIRPTKGLSLSFTEGEARLLAVTALGGLHVLLAGASGAGKSTLAKALRSLLSEPTAADIREGRVEDGWRPWIAPHHSVSALSLIGGGVPPRRGEISRADGGVLFLDELLEFPVSAQEALREPIETGLIRVSRGLRSRSFPARFQLIATTNLCPCGRWSPGVRVECGKSWKRCGSVVERISGPFFDRFDLLVLVEGRKTSRTIPGAEILTWIERARDFQRERLEGPGTDVLPEPWRSELAHPEFFFSERRRLSTLRVARLFADLDLSLRVQGHHVEEALEGSFRSFERLRATEVGV